MNGFMIKVGTTGLCISVCDFARTRNV